MYIYNRDFFFNNFQLKWFIYFEKDKSQGFFPSLFFFLKGIFLYIHNTILTPTDENSVISSNCRMFL